MTAPRRERLRVSAREITLARNGELHEIVHCTLAERTRRVHSEAIAASEASRKAYAQAFPSPGGKVQISTGGGERPRWSRDGKEIFFIAPDRKMMAVAVHSGAALEAGEPGALFDSHINLTDFNARFDVSKDGRFLIPVQPEQSNDPLTVIVNWPAIVTK